MKQAVHKSPSNILLPVAGRAYHLLCSVLPYTAAAQERRQISCCHTRTVFFLLTIFSRRTRFPSWDRPNILLSVAGGDKFPQNILLSVAPYPSIGRGSGILTPKYPTIGRGWKTKQVYVSMHYSLFWVPNLLTLKERKREKE